MFALLSEGNGSGKSEVTLADNVSVVELAFHNMLISSDTLPPFAILPDRQVIDVAMAVHPGGPET